MATLPPGTETPPYKRRHPEWLEAAPEWDWLYDSWEGGERYRRQAYGLYGGYPRHNLRRHKREVPAVPERGTRGSSPDASAWSDAFAMRLDRTPVPDWVSSACDTHLSKILASEVKRECKSDGRYQDFWDNVTLCGDSMDDLIRDVVGPMMLALGCVDVLVDHPRPEPGEAIESLADQERAGTDRAVLKVILPQNVMWWRLDHKGRYQEVVVREFGEDGSKRYRHWTPALWRLFDADGNAIDSKPHKFGRPPIARLFYRKKPRTRWTGWSCYYTIADLQREFYNRDSELIHSDTIQAFPIIQGPPRGNDQNAVIGPDFMLMKREVKDANGRITFEGYDTVDFPKDGAESLRRNKADLRDSADRSAFLTKPAGAAGTDGNTVAQSGLSKRIDQSAGNDFLARVASRLQAAEYQIAELVAIVLDDDPAAEPPEDLDVLYPGSFDLFTPEEFADLMSRFQTLAGAVGLAPKIEKAALSSFVRILLRGRSDKEYAGFDKEIDALVDDAATARKGQQGQAADQIAAMAGRAALAADPRRPPEPGAPPAETPDPTP